MGKSYKKNAKWEELNPDKMSRGHKFGRVGRSAIFKSKNDYKRKDKKNQRFDELENK